MQSTKLFAWYDPMAIPKSELKNLFFELEVFFEQHVDISGICRKWYCSTKACLILCPIIWWDISALYSVFWYIGVVFYNIVLKFRFFFVREIPKNITQIMNSWIFGKPFKSVGW